MFIQSRSKKYQQKLLEIFVKKYYHSNTIFFCFGDFINFVIQNLYKEKLAIFDEPFIYNIYAGDQIFTLLLFFWFVYFFFQEIFLNYFIIKVINHLFLGNFISDHYTIEMMKKYMLKFYHVEHEKSKLDQDKKKSFQKFFDNPKKLHQIKKDYVILVVYIDIKKTTSQSNGTKQY